MILTFISMPKCHMSFVSSEMNGRMSLETVVHSEFLKLVIGINSE